MKTKDLVLMAMFVALFSVLEYLSNTLGILQMPQGGSVGLSGLALLLAGYMMGFRKGLLVAVISVLVGFMLKPPYFYHWFQVFMDYFAAYGAYAFACLLPSPRIKAFALPLGVILADALRFMAHNISGWVFFSSYYEGNVLWGVVAYNATYMIPTFIVNFIFIAILLPRLLPLVKE